MAEAGRIKHHIANNVASEKNTILMVGYCAPATLGARLLGGTKEVSIHGNVYPVNAEIKKIESYSGHGDYKEMLEYLQCQEPSSIRQTFLVHGEYETQKKYAERMKEAGFRNIEIPSSGSEYQLDI